MLQTLLGIVVMLCFVGVLTCILNLIEHFFEGDDDSET